MIVNDHSPRALIRASLLSCFLAFTCSAAAVASDANPDGTLVKSATITLVDDGDETTFTTSARTVGDALDERGVHVAEHDALSPAPSTVLADGTRIVLRTAIPVQLRVGTSIRAIHSAAVTVADLLRAEHVAVSRTDVVTPQPNSTLVSNETVRVVRVRTWTSRERISVKPSLVNHADPTLAAGTTKIAATGAPGLRERTIRYTRVDQNDPSATVVATRTLRAPQDRIILHGTAAYRSLAHVASVGFESAVHMAGSALHMIATAYTAGCYGCSGITASGVRAGFGIIAVDPSVIPLGTKVYIPGYGHAVAGDTGGAIQGHRVDLGMNNLAEAIRFGRRPVMIYVLR